MYSILLNKSHKSCCSDSSNVSSKYHFILWTNLFCDESVFYKINDVTRSVWKVRGLTLLLWVGNLWRRRDGEVPPLPRDALLTTLHPLLENVLQTVDHFEIPCLGAPFSWLEKPRNRMGRDLDCMADVLMGFHRFTFSKPNTEFESGHKIKGARGIY
jgi:hypothetical protein